MKRLRHALAGYDGWLLTAYLGLVVMGLVFVYSASADFSLYHFDDPFYLIRRQVEFAGIGVLLALVVGWVDYRRWRRWAVPAMVVSILALMAVVVQHWTASGAGGRTLFGASVQPAEFAKLAYLLYLAVWLEARQDRLGDYEWGLSPFLVVLGMLAFLALLEPDLSAVITFALIGGTMFFLSGAPLGQVMTLLGLGLLFGLGGALAFPHGRDRLLTYWAGLHNVQQSYAQVQYSLMAFARGGWLGRGLGNSLLKVTGLPLPTDDAIFAVIGEEMGVLGVLLLVALFGVVLWRGMVIARRAPDVMGSLLAAGIALWLVFEAGMNMAAVLNVVPMTGNNLPLISSGGTNLTVSSIGIGWMLSVARQGVLQQANARRSLDAVVDLRRGHRRRGVSRPGGAPAAGG